MIKGEIIRELISLFSQRQVVLFHACQLIDFQSYIKVGGIPSRDTMVNSKLPFTPFDTDSTDKNNGVWDKVFLNFSDFGVTFAKGKAGLPNPFGPILLHVDPVAFMEASDIAISLRSAGASDFNRKKESLKTIQEVDRLFLHPQDSPYPSSTFVKFKEGLREEFNFSDAHSPEISITVKDGKLPLKYIKKVEVDPYKFNSKTLVQVTKEYAANNKFLFRVKSRKCKAPEIYNELAQFAFNPKVNLNSILKSEQASPTIKLWAEKVLEYNLDWQYKRFSKYLRQGTLKAL